MDSINVMQVGVEVFWNPYHGCFGTLGFMSGGVRIHSLLFSNHS